MTRRTWAARGMTVAAATAAISIVTASSASAHHCFKESWADAAYAHHAAGGTAWLPLSQLGQMIIADEEFGMGMPECAPYFTAELIQPWLTENGFDQEPLIHSKATVGGGALYNKGKSPKPFGYLDDEDFMALDLYLGMALEACMADQGA